MTPDCERVLDRLDAARLPPELEEHVEHCSHCQAARAGFDALPPVPEASLPPTSLSAAAVIARAELLAHPKVTPWWLEALGAAAVPIIAALLGIVVLSRHGVVHNRAPLPALVTVGLSLVLIIVWSAYAGMAPRARLHRLGVVAFAVETALLVGVAGSGFDPGPLLKPGLPCLLTEILVSLVPLAIVAVLLMRSAFDPLRTAVAGLGAAAAGVFTLHLHCAVGSARHLLLFHALPWLVLPLLLVAVRARLPSRSYAP